MGPISWQIPGLEVVVEGHQFPEGGGHATTYLRRTVEWSSVTTRQIAAVENHRFVLDFNIFTLPDIFTAMLVFPDGWLTFRDFTSFQVNGMQTNLSEQRVLEAIQFLAETSDSKVVIAQNFDGRNTTGVGIKAFLERFAREAESIMYYSF